MSATNKPAPRFGPKAQIHSLNGLRFVAAMVVVVYHYFGMGQTQAEGLAAAGPIGAGLRNWLPMFHRGHLAVDFFAILSGFVLSYAYRDEIIGQRFNCGEFMKRRFARIYPLHLVTLLFCVAMGAAATAWQIPLNNPDGFAVSAILPNIMMTHSFGASQTLTFNGPSWFISAEWFMYMAFPLLVLMLWKSGLPSSLKFLLAMSLFLAAYNFWRPGGELLTHRTYHYGVVRVALSFFIGLTLYELYTEYVATRSTSFSAIHVLLFGLFILVLAQMQADEGLIVAMFPFFIFACAAAEKGHGLRWLSHPWLLWGGQISFAIYMIHMPLFSAMRKSLQQAAMCPPGSLVEDLLRIACALLVVPLGWLAHEYIERMPYRQAVKTPATAPQPSSQSV